MSKICMFTIINLLFQSFSHYLTHHLYAHFPFNTKNFDTNLRSIYVIHSII